MFVPGQQIAKVSSPLPAAARQRVILPRRRGRACRAAAAGNPGRRDARLLGKTQRHAEGCRRRRGHARFRALGALLVKDGFAGAIIDLGREMTGGWYNWSERKCPRAEPRCYALAWRHAVDAMRSVPGQHFRFFWTAFPGAAAATDAWPGAAYVDLVGTDVYDWYGGPDDTYPHTASGQLDHDASGGRSSPSPAAWTGSRSCPGSPASKPPSPSGGWTSTASAARTTRRSSPACSPGCTPTTRSASTGQSGT